MSDIGVVKAVTKYADNTISYAERLSVYDSATENGNYYEIDDITKHGLFEWIGIIGETADTAEFRKTRIKNINTSPVASPETELIILIANMIGG